MLLQLLPVLIGIAGNVVALVLKLPWVVAHPVAFTVINSAWYVVTHIFPSTVTQPAAGLTLSAEKAHARTTAYLARH